ncbi:hypothetical protein EMELA_v1c08480 [Mesoplasma melaleucae]|uniref:Uncharacterized protein n=1 Tax=Mesoplasma melaleucae TaxID=81459 RepID=A0A2K8NWW0_9MOLU|nr:hypothetical protein EMELA_v1c08480 [Mesoplasma melaleucae]
MNKRINYLGNEIDISKNNSSRTIITSLSLSKETLELEENIKESWELAS